MKAVHYEGPFKVSVKEVPYPKIEHPDDVIIKVTTAGMSFSYWEASSLTGLASNMRLGLAYVPGPDGS